VFRLRPEHLAAFERAALESFEELAEKDLRMHNPNESAALDHEQMISFINAGITQAARLGLTTEYAVLCFLHIRLKRGPRWGDGEDGKTLRHLLLRGSWDQNVRGELAVNHVFRG
jgi:hypothetical protein